MGTSCCGKPVTSTSIPENYYYTTSNNDTSGTLGLDEFKTVLDLKNKLKDKSEFSDFCNKKFPNLENLNLSYNNLSDISELKNLIAPNLKILDLSGNQIENLEVFRELNFKLEELYLKGNSIKNLKILLEAKSLQNLRKLRIDNIDYESNKDILSKIKEKIKDFDIKSIINDDIIKKQLIHKISTKSLN